MAKPRTTRFRPKNRKPPRTTRPFTFYEMTERHIIHSKFQWRTSQLDQRRSRLVLDTYGEGTFRWSFRTSKGRRRTMPRRLFQNCLLENKVNVVVLDGPEPINEEGASLAEESESSHLSSLISSDGKDEAPISTDQTNFVGAAGGRNVSACKENGCWWGETLSSALSRAGGKAFSNMAVGYNNVDVNAATKYGVVVGNTPVSKA